MGVVTKKGDNGQSRFGGRTVDKAGPLLEAIGSIDELTAVLEVAKLKDKQIGDDLYRIMAVVADAKIPNSNLRFSIKRLEGGIKKLEEKKRIEGRFYKVGELDSGMNWARTVCRRTERRIVSLSKEKKIDKDILIYFNRLSDYLFLLAIK